jgi:predicted GIY-YIG superfamily endonuclease
MATPQGVVYLLHFDRPYKRARHYLGFAEDLERRLELHRAGRGSSK